MHTCDVIQKQHLYTFVRKCACVLRVCNVQIRSNKSRLFCHIVDTLINAFLIHYEWAAWLEQELVGFGNRLRFANQFFAAKKNNEIFNLAIWVECHRGGQKLYVASKWPSQPSPKSARARDQDSAPVFGKTMATATFIFETSEAYEVTRLQAVWVTGFASG